MGIVTRFFPNGEFTQGIDTMSARRKRRHENQRKHESLSQQCKEGYLEWSHSDPDSGTPLYTVGMRFINRDEGIYTYLGEDLKGHHYAYECDNYVLADVLMNEPIGRLIGTGELTPLGLSNARILTNPPSRKKCLTMSKSMARNIRNASYLLEREYGKDNLSFLTLTVPALNPDDRARVVTNWDKLIHRFLKWLRTKVNKHCMELKYVYCTEIQTKRLELRNEYVPHLHLLFRGRYGKKSPWAITPRMAREEWVRCLKSVCSGAFVTTALENLQRIRKSAGGYLSKYMSKGSNSLPVDDGQDIMATLQTHWGGMSRNLSRAIRTQTHVIRQDGSNGDIAAFLYQGLPLLLRRGLLRWWKRGEIRLFDNGDARDSRYLKVSVGCLRKPTLEGGLSDCLGELLKVFGEWIIENYEQCLTECP